MIKTRLVGRSKPCHYLGEPKQKEQKVQKLDFKKQPKAVTEGE